MTNEDFYNDLRRVFKNAYEKKVLELDTAIEDFKIEISEGGDYDMIKTMFHSISTLETYRENLKMAYEGLWINESRNANFAEFTRYLSDDPGRFVFKSFYTVNKK